MGGTSLTPYGKLDIGMTAHARKRASKVGRETWLADETVKHCMECGCSFDFFTRRHHCRACGRLLCSKCSRYQIEFTPESRRCESSYIEKKKRVCKLCFDKISARRKHGTFCFEPSDR